MTWRHRVVFAEDVFASASPVLRQIITDGGSAVKPRAIVVLDEGLVRSRPDLPADIERWFKAQADIVELSAPPITIPGGEAAKNSIDTPCTLLAMIESCRIDRHSFVIAAGGGAVLDVVGFVAAIAHRGCRHIRIPTTVLSQADSGVGVKNGVNAFGKKNFVGTFSPPVAVVNDFSLLATLPAREKRAGYAEAVKVACLRDDHFFEQMEAEREGLRAFEAAAMRRLIRRSAELHLDHIAFGEDPFELRSGRPLDFGHWAAHKLEQLSNFRVSHGEAVAIGVALDVIYSRRIGWLDKGSAERILGLLEALGFSLFRPELLQADSKGRLLIFNGLDEFREHLGGRLTLTLLKAIGQGAEANAVSENEMRAAIEELEKRTRL